jgi:4-hydroxythreonine-4-phosphate dehydrogenase
MSLLTEGRRRPATSDLVKIRRSAAADAGGASRSVNAVRPRLLVTMGDPSGIGPEVVLKACAVRKLRERFSIRVVGRRCALEQWSALFGIPLEVELIDPLEDATEATEFSPGASTPEGAGEALACIKAAAEMCLSGAADAMVTAPVSKVAMASRGIDFPGHTEYLARLTGASEYVMTFVVGGKRVALVTTHLSIADLPAAITRSLVLGKIRVLERGLREWFEVTDPRIAVTGLNPHAGEGGMFGNEETIAIAPAIADAVAMGIRAEGPFPADSIYCGLGGTDGPGAAFDAVLAMYHDQATIAAKLWGFSEGVNVTLGLPIVRTSADHGTAFGLAGRGEADPGSIIAAVTLAGEIAEVRARANRSESVKPGRW